MAAFIDEERSTINSFVLQAYIENVWRRLMTFPISFANTKRSCSCIECFVSSMFPNSGVDATNLLVQLELEYSLITVCFELILPDGVSRCLLEHVSCRLA